MIAARPSASAACRRGLSRAAGHLPGGRGDGRPAFSIPCGAAHLLLPGQGRAVPPAPSSSQRRGSDDHQRHEVGHVLRLFPLFLHNGRDVLRPRLRLGASASSVATRRPVAPIDDRGTAKACLGEDQGAQAGASSRARMTLSSGWEPGTRARRGLRVFFLLDCPGGAAAAGGLSPPSGQRPRDAALSAAGILGGYRGLSQPAPNLTASALREDAGSAKRGLSRPRARPTARGCFALFANSTTGGI